jgi:hypothetical protein
MPIPKTYKEQDSCLNCLHRFVWSEWDERLEYYCTQDGEKRPPCGSILLEEDFTKIINPHHLLKPIRDDKALGRELIALDETWQKWAEAHKVKANGICSNHKKDKNSS